MFALIFLSQSAVNLSLNTTNVLRTLLHSAFAFLNWRGSEFRDKSQVRIGENYNIVIIVPTYNAVFVNQLF